jgi:MarR family transcriptional regulator for hemolysin
MTDLSHLPSTDTANAADSAQFRWSPDGVGRHLTLAAKAARAFLEQLLNEAGASYGVWSVLAALTTSGPLIQRELAEHLSIEGPTLTRHLAQMERRGLVTRQRSNTDRRAATVALTEAGEQMWQRLTNVATDCHRQMIGDFTAEEIDALRGMLVRIQQNAQKAAATVHHSPNGGGQRHRT